jgi:hypothetical protein
VEGLVRRRAQSFIFGSIQRSAAPRDSTTSLCIMRSGKNQLIAVKAPRRKGDGATMQNAATRCRMGTASTRSHPASRRRRSASGWAP